MLIVQEMIWDQDFIQNTPIFCEDAALSQQFVAQAHLK